MNRSSAGVQYSINPFAGLENSSVCVLIRCQEGKTSAKLLEEQLMLPNNLERTIKLLPSYLELNTTVKNIIHKFQDIQYGC